MIDAFEECRKISDLLNSGDEGIARNCLIKLLDAFEQNNHPYNPLVNHLIRELGLYPYIKVENADWEDQFVKQLFEADIGGGKIATLHREQSRLLKALLSGKDLVISAPTSFGKSFVIDAFIAIKKPKNVVIIVPTIALTDETRRRLYKKFARDYKIITTSDVPLSEKNIFIFPQERALGYITLLPEIDILIVDEFHKADSKYDEDRSSSLLRAIAHLKKVAGQRYFLAPNIEAIHDNPFTGGMEFIPFDLNTVFLEKHNWYKKIGKDKGKKTEIFLKLISKLDNRKTLVYAGTYPEITAISTLLLADSRPANVSDILQKFISWLEKNYDSAWTLPKLIARKTGLHNARLHRPLTQIQVKLFEEENGLSRLVSTTSIVEGVNTSAENIVLWKNKKGNRNLDDFTYRNIIGRGGRMFRHFVGKIYILEQPPQETEQTLDLNIDDGALISFDDVAVECLTMEQIKKLKASQEELRDVIGADSYKEIFEQNTLQSSEMSLFKTIAVDMKNNSNTWNGLNYLNSTNPDDWVFLLNRIIGFQAGAWGIRHGSFVDFIKILSCNWITTITELLDRASSANIDTDKFFELERNVAVKLSPLLQDVNVIQKAVLRHLSVDLAPMIKKISYAFLPPVVYQLEEYGLPRMISRKIHDARVINFEDNKLTLHDTLNKFMVIGRDNLFKQVLELDDFDRYIIDYFYDGISLSEVMQNVANEKYHHEQQT